MNAYRLRTDCRGGAYWIWKERVTILTIVANFRVPNLRNYIELSSTRERRWLPIYKHLSDLDRVRTPSSSDSASEFPEKCLKDSYTFYNRYRKSRSPWLEMHIAECIPVHLALCCSTASGMASAPPKYSIVRGPRKRSWSSVWPIFRRVVSPSILRTNSLNGIGSSTYAGSRTVVTNVRELNKNSQPDSLGIKGAG